MGLRHAGRELALKALYQLDMRGELSNEEVAAFFEAFPADDRVRLFALRLVDGVQRDRAALDTELVGALEHWSINRLSRVDHNILRLALYELTRIDDIPARVTIDEAIELAKTYGDSESGRFVNGVLDQVAARLKLKDKGEESNPDKRYSV
jgi:transcription antitermination factor NusB